MVFHAARHHDAAVAACTQIPSKGAETSAFTMLLDQLDDDQLHDALITADAAGWKNLESGRRAHTNPDKILALHGITRTQPIWI